MTTAPLGGGLGAGQGQKTLTHTHNLCRLPNPCHSLTSTLGQHNETTQGYEDHNDSASANANAGEDDMVRMILMMAPTMG